MILPSCVVFLRLRNDARECRRLPVDRKGGGSDECDVRAGVLERPRGSLRADSRESRITEPGWTVSWCRTWAGGLTWHLVGGLLVEDADAPFPALRAALFEPVGLGVCHLERYKLAELDELDR
jgi:hypothetical protein